MKAMNPLPQFPYHRDPEASGSFRKSEDPCECCGKARGVLYAGNSYCQDDVENLCPWCIADGTAAQKYEAEFFDAYFCDDDLKVVEMPEDAYVNVFGRTIGFATFNPIGWWVHCNEPAEYVKRKEPYQMIFECRVCHRQHSINDLD